MQQSYVPMDLKKSPELPNNQPKHLPGVKEDKKKDNKRNVFW